MKFRVLVSLALSLVVSSAAFGQATRTWVSGVGDDVNPCSRTAPCKTFAGAISKTFIGGEINIIDSGGFGAITITKSITIDGIGAHGSILGSGTNGVTINLAVNSNDPLKRVILRNLSINGTGASGTVGTNTGINGVNITGNGATSVIMENVRIMNFNRGISVTNSVNTVNMFLSNVDISTCSTNGISLVPTGSGVVVAMLNGVRVSEIGTTGTHHGIVQNANTVTHMKNVEVFSSAGSGLQLAGTPSAATIENSSFVRNGNHGVHVNAANAVVRVGHSTATQNFGSGFQASLGTIFSYRNNQSSDNGIADTANTQQAVY